MTSVAWLSLSLLASPATTRADDPVLVFDVAVDDEADAPFASILTEALQAEVARVPGFRRSAYPCEPVACVARVFDRRVRARWVVLPRLRRHHERHEGSYVVELRLWSVRDRRVLLTLRDHVRPGDTRTMPERATSYLRRLAQGVPESAGRLSIPPAGDAGRLLSRPRR